MTIDTHHSFADGADPAGGRARTVSATGLALTALVHVLVAISFLFVAAFAARSAHAGDAVAAAPAEAVSCGGRDLLAAMAKTDPAERAGIEAKAAKVGNGSHRFWKIEAKAGDVAPSWLYGTMHVTDPRVLKLPGPAAEALDKAQTVVIETTDILDQTKMQAEVLSHPDLMMFTDGTTLESLLSPHDLALVKDKLKQRGLSIGLVSRMKPWILASLVATPACEQARKSAGVDFLDKRIAEDAKAKGKDVEGLETLNEQLSALASLPMKFHIRGLVESLEMGKLVDDVSVTMTDLYLAGKIGEIMPMMEAVSPKQDEAAGSGYAEFQKRIVTDRNQVMATRAQPIIDRGDAFIAVGALHLPGDDGVIARLRRAGYTVTAAAK